MQTPLPPQFLLDTLFPDQSGTPTGLSVYTGNDDHKIPTPVSQHNSRPHVTLTFAQSLDAKIAGKGGKQLILSGKESLIMTHWMRTMHDAILVGIGTALNDDPQLNTRHLPPLPAGSSQRYHLPRPVILDTNLRLPPTCKLLKNYAECRGRRPWVIGLKPSDENLLSEWLVRKQALENAGARVHLVSAARGPIALGDCLRVLRELEVRSLMVEGGAQVLQSFLEEQQADSNGYLRPIADAIIVTVSPTFVGSGGVGYETGLTAEQVLHLKHTKTEVFGRDVVMAMNFHSNA